MHTKHVNERCQCINGLIEVPTFALLPNNTNIMFQWKTDSLQSQNDNLIQDAQYSKSMNENCNTGKTNKQCF